MRQMLKAFFKDSAIYAVPVIFSRGMAFFLLPIYTRLLKPEEFGFVDIFIILGSLVNILITLEVSQGVARFFSSEQDEKKRIDYVSSALTFTVLSYILFLVFSLTFSSGLSSFVLGRSDMDRVFQIGILYICFHGIFYFVQSQLRWELRSKHHAFVSLFFSITTASSCIAFAYFLQLGLIGFLSGMLLGAASSSFLGLWLIRHSFVIGVNFKFLREILVFSSPLVFSSMAVWVSLFVDRIMISQFMSIGDLGVYGIGFRLAALATLLTAIFQSALTPLVFAKFNEPETPKRISDIFRLFIVLASFIFLFLTFFASDLVKLFASPAYFGASSLAVFLVPAAFFSGMYIFVPGLNIAKKTHIVALINILAAVVNIFLNFFFIPLFGLEGAAAATMTSSVLAFVLYVIGGNRFYTIPIPWLKVVSALGLSAVLAVCVPNLDSSIGQRTLINLTFLTIFLLFSYKVGLFKKREIKLATGQVIRILALKKS